LPIFFSLHSCGWFVYRARNSKFAERSKIAYAFGLQELNYTGTGTLSSQLDYYSLAGHLIGSTNGSSTTYDLTDAQGSILATFSASAIQGNQRYTQGSIGTDKGYTGQFQDAFSGLDYYNARYYDPVSGVFLSPDSKQGNAQGMNPYSYVGGNPTTRTDPTGQKPAECLPTLEDQIDTEKTGDICLSTIII
jgi:RHS repeat-associated protein